MGSSERVLELIRTKAADEYPHLDIITYSPPFKAVFSTEENDAIIEAINDAKPDLLWIGMTAPKKIVGLKLFTKKMAEYHLREMKA